MTDVIDIVLINAYLDSVEARVAARLEQQAADAKVREALDAEYAARLAVILSVPCPYCGEGRTELCTNEYSNGVRTLGTRAQHGMRADLSGVNGEHSYRRAKELEARRGR